MAVEWRFVEIALRPHSKNSPIISRQPLRRPMALSIMASCPRVSENEFRPSVYRVNLSLPRILCGAIYCLYQKHFHDVQYVQMASREGLLERG